MNSKGPWSGSVLGDKFTTKEAFIPNSEIASYIIGSNISENLWDTYFSDIDDLNQRIAVGSRKTPNAYVLVRDGLNNSWTSEYHFQYAPNNPGLMNIAISGDGNRIAVTSAPDPYVWVARREGNTYINEYTLNSFGDGDRSLSGFSVDIDYSGTRFIMVNPSTGQLYIFVRTGTTWELEHYLNIDTPYNPNNPPAVYTSAISDNGDRVAIASMLECKIYILVRNGSTWSIETRITGFVDALDSYGRYMSMSGDGSIIVVGQYYTQQAHVYVRSGTTWSLYQSLSPPASSDQFGHSVSISGDGNTIAVGSYIQKEAFIFKKIEGVWTLVNTLTPSMGANGYGYPVRLSHNGSNLLVSAFYSNYLYIYGNS